MIIDLVVAFAAGVVVASVVPRVAQFTVDILAKIGIKAKV